MITRNKDSLGDRMKKNYEQPYQFYLTRRTPVIIRLDMNAGHHFTEEMNRPFDTIFVESMHNTCIALSEQIMNVEFAYTQSDEINLLLVDYRKLSSGQWLDGNIQKIVSISASIATIEFNRAYTHAILNHKELANEEIEKYTVKINKMSFDSRVFNIPDSEVVNYFIWRQTDCAKNSVQAAGQYYFNQNQLQNLNNNMIQEKLRSIGINWANYPNYFKRGVCAKKESYIVHDELKNEDIKRYHWIIDYDIPIFTKDRDYIAIHLRQADDH